MSSLFSNPIARVGLILGLFAIGVTSLVAFTEQQTRDQIKQNEREALLNAINELVPSERFDNDILTDKIEVQAADFLGTDEAITVYRARMNLSPVAAVYMTIAPDGYNGRIKLLVGINTEGTLSGVRVIDHKETPGLGDKVDIKRSDWILGFTGKSLNNPTANNWNVKKDGGEFDQFTGATITPRAVVKAVKNALLYYENNRDKLFELKEEG